MPLLSFQGLEMCYLTRKFTEQFADLLGLIDYIFEVLEFFILTTSVLRM